MKAPGFPFRRSDGIVLLDAYIPASGHQIIAEREDDPDNPLAVIDFDALGPCPGRTRAPTMTETGLIVLLVLLVAAGSWLLGRRSAFYESMPRV